MSYWIACKSAPQYEAAVSRRLVDMLGCVIYLPRVRIRLERSRRIVTAPLFRTYLFADVDQGPPWQAIRRQPGVVNIVMTGEQPSRCPESEILKLQASEIGGLVQLADQPLSSDQRFTEGQAVKIRSGAFEGRPARYSKPARKNMSVVFVALLNRVVAVQVPTHALAAVG